MGILERNEKWGGGDVLLTDCITGSTYTNNFFTYHTTGYDMVMIYISALVFVTTIIIYINLHILHCILFISYKTVLNKLVYLKCQLYCMNILEVEKMSVYDS